MAVVECLPLPAPSGEQWPMLTPSSVRPRDYTPLLALSAVGDRDALMKRFCDRAWELFGDRPDGTGHGVSWIGFYLWSADRPEEMTLAYCRNKPACSPIGLHGVCGQGWKARRSIIVRDVAVMGPGYIACDPRDRSEVVVPCLNPDGSCWGVLDVDSWALAAFDVFDALSYARALHHLGLTAIGPGAPADVLIKG